MSDLNEVVPISIPETKSEVRSRPLGVTLIAALLLAYAAWLTYSMGSAVLHPERFQSADLERNKDIAWDFAVLTPIRIAVAFSLAGGLWNLKRWARKGLIFLSVLAILVRATALALPATSALILKNEVKYSQQLQIALAIVLISYLVSTKVSLVFELGRQSED